MKAGHTATFVIWVWSSNAASRGVTVTLSVAFAEDLGKPAFSICPDADGKTCKLGNMPAAQADELEAGVPVEAKAALGEQIQLTAKATAKGSKSFSASATDVVVVSPPPSTPTPSPLPALPATTVPPITGTGSSPSNLFPTVTPVPSSSPSLGLPSIKPKRTAVGVTDAADTVPLDPRLIGGQLAGLAVLAGGIAIAIARLSLRTPKPQDDKGGQGPQQ